MHHDVQRDASGLCMPHENHDVILDGDYRKHAPWDNQGVHHHTDHGPIVHDLLCDAKNIKTLLSCSGILYYE